MTINLNNTVFDSSLSGLSNSSNINTTINMLSQTLSANEIRIITIQPVSLNNANAITSVQVNFGGVETVWRPIYGYLQKTIGVSNYDIICLTKYSGSNLLIYILVADDTGLTNTIPAISFNFRINTYLAPF
jgi:hypothetical protein